jgi:two-component system OmpR family response regulator
MAIRILLIEDEVVLAHRIMNCLTRAGFVLDHAVDGDKGHYLGEINIYDAAVLDLGLPTMSGIEVLKSWRNRGRVMPVLILTARSGWSERVNGLNSGADDYLEKPFQVQELIARIRSLVRRSTGKISPVLRHGDMELNSATGTVTKAGETVQLTAQELRILSYLMHCRERFISQGELLDHIYAMDELRNVNTVEVYIARLRKKLGSGSIRTIRGMGYRVV